MTTPADFVEILFDPTIAAGARGGPGFRTTVHDLTSGEEVRNMEWSRERPVYEISTALKQAADFRYYTKFFYARRGRAVGFLWFDHADYQNPFWNVTPGDDDPLPLFLTTDGTTDTVQLTKTYDDGGDPFIRKMVKIIPATYEFYADGVAMTEGAGGSQFQIDPATGILTLGATLAATAGVEITGYHQFYVPVRFDTDSLNATIDAGKVMVWDSIPIVGLKL